MYFFLGKLLAIAFCLLNPYPTGGKFKRLNLPVGGAKTPFFFNKTDKRKKENKNINLEFQVYILNNSAFNIILFYLYYLALDFLIISREC